MTERDDAYGQSGPPDRPYTDRYPPNAGPPPGAWPSDPAAQDGQNIQAGPVAPWQPAPPPPPPPYGNPPTSGYYGAGPAGPAGPYPYPGPYPGQVPPGYLPAAPKSVGVAVLLSFLWLGAGHLYAGKIATGIVLLVVDLILIMMSFFVITLILTIPAWLILVPIAMITSAGAVKEHNMALGYYGG